MMTDKKSKPAPVSNSLMPSNESKNTVSSAPSASSMKPAALQTAGFPVVGIGASAGGLAAFEAFFSAMPADTQSGMAFVLVQHLSPDHKSLLVDLVKRYTRMGVYEIEDGMVVHPNCAYIIPPNHDITFVKGRLHLLEPAAPRGLRLPIDSFFRSLAQDQHERAICIVLSGTGSDGTSGVRAVKGEGGMAIAQLPESAEYDGMPRSAIDTGLVDFVLPPTEMPPQLISYVSHAFGKIPQKESFQTPLNENIPQKICALLKSKSGHDFSKYKKNTLIRRIERRMALHQINSPRQYIQFLQKNAAEIDALFRDLLIGVTRFFRDQEAFELLKKQAIPRLFKHHSENDTIRIWACGCSTGEEAYSIAILFQEYLEQTKQNIGVQIFATDIDSIAIEQARSGIFPASITSDILPERLARFFILDKDKGVYYIQKSVRNLLIFSEQDVIKDPPFSKMDMISCRNLLIYLNAELQKQLISLFHYALNPNGILFLGSSETIGEFASLFTPLNTKWKLFQRKQNAVNAPLLFMGISNPLLMKRNIATQLRSQELHEKTAPTFRELTEQAVLRHYVQAAILVTGSGDILHIIGRTGKYLEPSPGDAEMNILSMARDGLRRQLTTTLHQVATHHEPVCLQKLQVKSNGDFTSVKLTVLPLDTAVKGRSLNDLYLVLLDETPPAVERQKQLTGPMKPSVGSDRRIAELERELLAKEEYLQATLEEMQSSNEELTSSNEEMQSINEELQSTNEELETSKEELQSVNEELATVNAELQDRVADLSRANNDMNNLLAGTGVATLFVDHQLHITRFTPAITQLINLIESDIGRPVRDIVANLVDYDCLVQDIERVLNTLESREIEVQTKNGAWFLMRIRPYRTLENIIEGAVIIFVDVTDRKQMEESLHESENRLHAIVEQAIAGISQVDLKGRFLLVNDHFCQSTGYNREELLQMRMQNLTYPEDLPCSQDLFLRLVKGGQDYHIETRYCRKDGSVLWFNNNINGIRNQTGAVQSIVVVSIDITDFKQAEKNALFDKPADPKRNVGKSDSNVKKTSGDE